MIHYLSPLDKSNSYASYKPFKPQHQRAPSPHCSSYGTAWEIFFFNITTFHLWFIISWILMICLFDQAVLLLGEIGCESLLALKGLMMADRWPSTSLFPVPFWDSVQSCPYITSCSLTITKHTFKWTFATFLEFHSYSNASWEMPKPYMHHY